MSKLRKSAKGQYCTLQIPGVCNHDPETTVLCHVSWRDGAGGYKTSDLSALYACSTCHDALDGRGHSLSLADKFYYQGRGITRTHEQMLHDGVLVVK